MFFFLFFFTFSVLWQSWPTFWLDFDGWLALYWRPLYWFGYLLPIFLLRKIPRISGGSGSRHIWFCNYWPSCRALLITKIRAIIKDISDRGHFGQSQFRHFVSSLVCSNQILGNFWPTCGGLYINIETIINLAGVQNSTKVKT